jgi:uncharacterized protein
MHVTLITGASSGLGVDFARRLAAENHNLVLVARREDKLQTLADELKLAHGISVFVEPCDLAKPGAVAKLMATLAKQGLEVSCLINNAGFGLNGEFGKLDGPRQTEMINLNCTALTELCHAVLPSMMNNKSGQILNVASTAAFQAGPLMAVYYASKAYVLSFSEALHEELRPYGIHVTALCPGPTETEFFDAAKMGKSLLAKMQSKSSTVVDDGLRALKLNRAIVISGFINKITAQSARLVPRAFTRKLAQSLQR